MVKGFACQDSVPGDEKPGGVCALHSLNRMLPSFYARAQAYMHEVALAVKVVDEAQFFEASHALFAAQAQFFDDQTADKSRTQLYDELVAVVATMKGTSLIPMSLSLSCQY